MSKRKYADYRSGQSGPSGNSESKIQHRGARIDGLLDHGKRTIFQSLKVARGFERQKLGRRQKNAKAEQSEADIARFEAEVTALKNLDLQKLAEIHLYKSLIKSIASAPDFPEKIYATLESHRQSHDAASANVQARLFKSNPVHTAMGNAMNSIRSAFGIEEIKHGAGKRLRAKDFARGNEQSSCHAAPAEEPKWKERHHVSSIHSDGASAISDESEEVDSWDGFSSQGNQDAINKANQSSDESADYSQYASHLAGSSEEDSENGDNKYEIANHQLPQTEIPAGRSSDEEITPSKMTKIKRESLTVPKTTTFLPSLATGGYWSGSETASDNEGENVAKIQTRKNRMGQQARRALWEKKFGKGANHVKKQEQSRDHGWDPRKGASGGDEWGQLGRGRGGKFRDKTKASQPIRAVGRGQPQVSSGANSDPMGQRKAKPRAEAPLHPSWEAAKKAKEKQQKPVAFQGKKVVFN